MIAKALTIAGSDSGGGAGIQADLKTFMALEVYGSVVLTAVTAQNTTGVQAAYDLPLDLIARQFDAVMFDIGADAAKTGMLSSSGIVELVAAKVQQWRLRNLVVDPVMVAKGGDLLLSKDARETLIKQLVPLAAVLTPNHRETSELTGMTINCLDDARQAARRLLDLGPRWVVVKGGRLPGVSDAVDVVANADEVFQLPGARFDSRHTHGTGCTFSAAIAAGLAQGLDPAQAIRKAKRYTAETIRTAPGIGSGHGPVNHLAGVRTEWGEDL